MKVRIHAAALAAVALVSSLIVASPAEAATLVPIGIDGYTNADSSHATQVEPDSFAFGNVVVSAAQTGRYFDGGSSNINVSVSTDAGATWFERALPGITNNNIAAPGPNDRVSDPVVAYDAKHGVWMVSSLPLTEAGGVRGVGIYTSRSIDNGSTWSNPVLIPGSPTGNPDKNWIVCDNTATSPFYGNCYTEWDDNGTGNTIRMSTSSDGGLTWSTKVGTSGSSTGIGGQPLVQPNGTVVVPIMNANETQIRSFRSTNGGGSWSATQFVTSVTAHTVAGGVRTPPLPSAEIDAAGKVYVVWHDCRFRTQCRRNDIVMTTSTNGTTWSPVVRIPIDGTGSTVDHFTPGLGVGPASQGATARLALTYYYYPSSNCTAATCSLRVGYVSSANGGSSWSAPTQLAGPMNVSWLPQTTQGRMFGDYISTSFVAGAPLPFFTAGSAPAGSVFDLRLNTTTGLTVAGGRRPARAGPLRLVGSGDVANTATRPSTAR
jgi:BNR repeat-like domain